MKVAALTDRGRVRPNNEDLVYADAEKGILIVADGMGGHAAGEVASRIAVETIARLLTGFILSGEMASGSGGPLLRRALLEANAAIREKAASDPALYGMATTAVAAVCRGGDVLLAHLGDSRAYLVRDGRLRRLTCDHSLVEEMVQAGRLSEREARHHHLRHIVTRSLGVDEVARPDLAESEWAPGDILLLCSDGLTAMLDDEDIAAAFASRSCDLQETAVALVEEANRRGGYDNISVVLALNQEDLT